MFVNILSGSEFSHIIFCRANLECLLNSITEAIQVTEGRRYLPWGPQIPALRAECLPALCCRMVYYSESANEPEQGSYAKAQIQVRHLPIKFLSSTSRGNLKWRHIHFVVILCRYTSRVGAQIAG